MAAVVRLSRTGNGVTAPQLDVVFYEFLETDFFLNFDFQAKNVFIGI